MVIGGQNEDFENEDFCDEYSCKISRVELVSLDPAGNPVPECLTNLASLPYDLAGASAGITSGRS